MITSAVAPVYDRRLCFFNHFAARRAALQGLPTGFHTDSLAPPLQGLPDYSRASRPQAKAILHGPISALKLHSTSPLWAVASLPFSRPEFLHAPCTRRGRRPDRSLSICTVTRNRSSRPSSIYREGRRRHLTWGNPTCLGGVCRPDPTGGVASENQKNFTKELTLCLLIF